MAFQVLINFNMMNKPLHVANSLKEFEKTTVLELKQKFTERIHGAPDPNDIRVVFGKDPLEDHLTLGFYKIKHLSVLFIVMKMPGARGGPAPNPREGFPRSRMAYQVLVNFNERKNKPLDVADSLEEFEKTTILELKKKLREQIPGAPDPDQLRVIFGKDPLEDHRTFVFYNIKHLSVLLIVMKMPGGPGPNPPGRFPRSESMERIYYRTMNNPNPGKSSEAD